MKKIWIVNMGIGEKCDKDKPTRVFESKNEALDWVKSRFKENRDYLESEKSCAWSSQYGLNIGNSFHIYEKEIDTLN